MDISYASVILARNLYAKRVEFRPGPYTLGKWQMPINAITCVWVCFISIVLLFPTIRPVTALNMNYAVVVGAFIALFSMSWWWAGARNNYAGPKTENLAEFADEEDDYEEADEDLVDISSS